VNALMRCGSNAFLVCDWWSKYQSHGCASSIVAGMGALFVENLLRRGG